MPLVFYNTWRSENWFPEENSKSQLAPSTDIFFDNTG